MRTPDSAATLSRPVRLAWFSLGSSALVEVAMAGGADMAVIDLQHGLWDRASTFQAVGAAGPDRAMVRAAANSPIEISRGLDTGAAAILIPLVETAQEAQSGVRASRFPPEGDRSGGGVRPVAMGFGRYLERPPPRVGVMIETRTGLENADAIAGVNGVDFVFIGPGDLSLSLGAAADLEEPCRRILRACQAAGKPCGLFTPSDEANRRLAEGFAMVVAADDLSVVSRGFALKREPDLGASTAVVRRSSTSNRRSAPREDLSDV